MIRPGSIGSGNMTRARPIERFFRRRLTVLLAFGAFSGCMMEEEGVHPPPVSPAGGGGSVSLADGTAASGGASWSSERSGGASGSAGTPASEAGAGSGGSSFDGGTSGTDAAAGSGGTSASGGTSGGGTAAGSGGASTRGTSGSEAGAGSGGSSASGGTSSSDPGSGSGGSSASGGTSGTDAAAGSGGTSTNGGTSGTDAAAGSGGSSTSGGTSGSDAGSGLKDGAGADGSSGKDAGAESAPSPSWQLVWWDEFNLGPNFGVDATKWNVATWEPNTVNGEQQKYTTRPQNVFYDNQGHLVLRGLHDSWNSNGTVYPYTSGRLQTDGKFQFGSGHRLEVRAKLPAGRGSFPAILLMGTTGNWPQCGEIGLMEQWGQDKSWLYCSTYSGGSSDIKQQVTFPSATTLSSDFHVYVLDWYSDHMVFFIDGMQVARSNFDATSPFFTGTYYLIFDVAIGGTMGGTIDDAGGFPMDMVLDYVRVYSQ